MSSTRTRIHPDKNPEQTQENKKMWLSINVNLEVLAKLQKEEEAETED
jgi:hypothetical protein